MHGELARCWSTCQNRGPQQRRVLQEALRELRAVGRPWDGLDSRENKSPELLLGQSFLLSFVCFVGLLHPQIQEPFLKPPTSANSESRNVPLAGVPVQRVVRHAQVQRGLTDIHHFGKLTHKIGAFRECAAHALG